MGPDPLMSVIEAIVLGIIQGLGEFLPISSSGHLELARWFFGWDGLDENLEQSFDVAVHLGTLVAVIIYFRHDLWAYLLAGLKSLTPAGRPLSTDARIAWLLVVSTIPAAITGVLLEDVLAADRIWLIAVALIVGGLVLWWADRLPGSRTVDDFTLRDALLIGGGQALALQPGVSRSGVTITVGRVLRFGRAAAARIAFLMSVPVIAGAGLYQGVSTEIPSDFVSPFLWGMISAGVTGYLAIWGTLRLVQRWSFTPFVVYRVALGTLVLLLLAAGY